MLNINISHFAQEEINTFFSIAPILRDVYSIDYKAFLTLEKFSTNDTVNFLVPTYFLLLIVLSDI